VEIRTVFMGTIFCVFGIVLIIVIVAMFAKNGFEYVGMVEVFH
jgi:hypothetical protein